jgi:hypothetical protein
VSAAGAPPSTSVASPNSPVEVVAPHAAISTMSAIMAKRGTPVW